MANEVQVTIEEENYTTKVAYGDLSILADEPLDLGGQNKGLTPTQLLLASIGSCKVITMRMYANRKQWDVKKINIDLSSEVVKSDLQQTTYIRCHITFEGNLDEDQIKRLYVIADKCPIHKMLQNPIVIESNVIDTTK
ncbi:OsmC family protein [Sphingobacterium hotanense]|uniref:OsmC family protein n=1 Tax=Sphingobacterium hotanense TaxID=649196 RepID=UPI0021A8C8F4|nr:OsmC family protein [Sphingobacterium hotanense]MCT1526607.1 OsmC family protein [Sphingobacterium hotanense]